MYHRKGVDILKGFDMGSSRNPGTWTPYTAAELRTMRAEMGRKSEADLRAVYRDMLASCRLDDQLPSVMPKPWVIQTLIQAWRELHRRYPPGR